MPPYRSMVSLNWRRYQIPAHKRERSGVARIHRLLLIAGAVVRVNRAQPSDATGVR